MEALLPTWLRLAIDLLTERVKVDLKVKVKVGQNMCVCIYLHIYICKCFTMKYTDVYYFLIYWCKIKASALTMGLRIGVLCPIFCITIYVVSSLSFSKLIKNLNIKKNIKLSELQTASTPLWFLLISFVGILPIFISDSPLLKISRALNFI